MPNISSDMNFFYETNSNGTIYNLIARKFLDKFTFDAFDKILNKTKNENDILNKTILVKRGREESEETVLSVFLRAFLNITTKYISYK